MHLLAGILQTRITVASGLASKCTLGHSHTRWSRVHWSTQRPRISTIRIACEEGPASRTRIRAGCSIDHTAGIDTESVPVSANLGRVAGTWHRAIRVRCCKIVWQAVVTVAFGSIFKALGR